MKAEYKVPGGKLLACEVYVEDGVIKDLKLSGDFFMHPESVIIDLEEEVKGTTVVSYHKKIFNFFKDKDITLFGVAPEDFITVIKLGLDSE